jgi:hypothetical protein
MYKGSDEARNDRQVFVEWARQVPKRMGEVKASMREQGFSKRSLDGDFIVFIVEDPAKAAATF